MLLLIPFVLCFVCVGGFSLQNDEKIKRYLTVSQYIDDQQIQQRFSFMPLKPSETFSHLEQNLKGRSAETETKQLLQMSIEELTMNLNDLQHRFTLLQSEFDVLKRSSTGGNSLKLQEQVTVDDFRTLYNETVNNKRLQNMLRNEMKYLATMVSHNSENISSIHENMMFGEPKLDGAIDDIRKIVKDLRNAYNETVTLSAKGSTNQVNAGSIIKFPNIDRYHGVTTTSLNKFKSSGQFACVKEGLYIIAANVISSTEGSWFKLSQNNVELTRTYIAYHNGKANGWHSSTGITYAILKKGDLISVVAGTSMSLSGTETTLTIVKIK